MGFMSMGPLGALAGYFIGAWFDRKTAEGQGAAQGTAEERARFEQGQRNSFLFSMLVMASYVMRADKRVMHSEMEFVRRFLRTNFGESAVEQGEQILLKLFAEAKRLDQASPTAYREMIFDCGRQIAANLNYGERLQLLGLTEVFSAIPSILALRREMVERIIERAPEAVVVCAVFKSNNSKFGLSITFCASTAACSQSSMYRYTRDFNNCTIGRLVR